MSHAVAHFGWSDLLRGSNASVQVSCSRQRRHCSIEPIHQRDEPGVWSASSMCCSRFFLHFLKPKVACSTHAGATIFDQGNQAHEPAGRFSHPTVIESARCLAPASQCLPDSRLTIGLKVGRRRFFEGFGLRSCEQSRHDTQAPVCAGVAGKFRSGRVPPARSSKARDWRKIFPHWMSNRGVYPLPSCRARQYYRRGGPPGAGSGG